MLKKNISLGIFLLWIAVALAGGFFAGFVLGDQHILIPKKGQLLLMSGVLSQSLYELGKIQEANGEFQKAEKSYREALAINPHLGEVYDSLKKFK